MLSNISETETVRKYESFGFFDTLTQKWIIPRDNGRYIKFTDNKNFVNIRMDPVGEMRTTRRIYAGEELLEDFDDYMNQDDIDRYRSAKETFEKYCEKALEKEKKAMSDMRQVSLHLR